MVVMTVMMMRVWYDDDDEGGDGSNANDDEVDGDEDAYGDDNGTLKILKGGSYVNPAAARQTLKQIWRPPGRLQSVFGGRYRDSRVFLAAAILTLESFWGRVVLACYTGQVFNLCTSFPPTVKTI
ncbi:hypothetical protein PoB_003700700 [Plakobranchus ocellatus]|uniref:Uncharacterized protein n=1 Tax=Plakobranchus ocellatus TaxID=259542 RepID=A0AAV4AU90_9GAST|nr:hypothetical protein PoB_003700700 [Plakobranchus ocellatus]